MILEEVLNYKSYNSLGQEATKSILEPIRERRGEDMWKLNTEKMVWTRNEISTDDPKGYDSRVPIEM